MSILQENPLHDSRFSYDSQELRDAPSFPKLHFDDEDVDAPIVPDSAYTEPLLGQDWAEDEEPPRPTISQVAQMPSHAPTEKAPETPIQQSIILPQRGITAIEKIVMIKTKIHLVDDELKKLGQERFSDTSHKTLRGALTIIRAEIRRIYLSLLKTDVHSRVMELNGADAKKKLTALKTEFSGIGATGMAMTVNDFMAEYRKTYNELLPVLCSEIEYLTTLINPTTSQNRAESRRVIVPQNHGNPAMELKLWNLFAMIHGLQVS
jgi:hypothetical protein